MSRLVAAALVFMLVLCSFGCGYRFAGGAKDNPYPEDLKTISVESAVNNTTVTGIETELTNDLRRELALGTQQQLVNSNGDVAMKSVIAMYNDVPSTYTADGKELTRMGTLQVDCALLTRNEKKELWSKSLTASYPYGVTDSISGTLTNRRRAISRMIKDLVPRIHRSLYDRF